MSGNQRIRCLRYIFILLVCFFIASPTHAKGARTITAEQWHQLTDDKAFSYRTQKELLEIKQQNQTKGTLAKILEMLFAFFASPAGKAVVWTILVLIVVFVIYRILVNERTSLFRKKPKTIPEEEDKIQEEPEDILSGNWDHLLHEALKKHDTRLAIRYSYMLMLQLLQHNHLIQYRPDKTNYDYYYELKSPEVKQNFKLLSRQYEFAWYGDYPVAKEKFDQYMVSFNQVKDMLRGR